MSYAHKYYVVKAGPRCYVHHLGLTNFCMNQRDAHRFTFKKDAKRYAKRVDGGRVVAVKPKHLSYVPETNFEALRDHVYNLPVFKEIYDKHHDLRLRRDDIVNILVREFSVESLLLSRREARELTYPLERLFRRLLNEIWADKEDLEKKFEVHDAAAGECALVNDECLPGAVMKTEIERLRDVIRAGGDSLRRERINLGGSEYLSASEEMERLHPKLLAHNKEMWSVLDELRKALYQLNPEDPFVPLIASVLQRSPEPRSSHRHDLDEYIEAVGNSTQAIGQVAQDWLDKPHRLVYDLVNRIRSDVDYHRATLRLAGTQTVLRRTRNILIRFQSLATLEQKLKDLVDAALVDSGIILSEDYSQTDEWRVQEFLAVQKALQEDGTRPASDTYSGAVRTLLREVKELRYELQEAKEHKA